MPIEQWIKSKYAYILLLTAWLVIDGWFIYQFQANLGSGRSPRLVQATCESILGYLFQINLLCTGIGVVLSAIHFRKNRSGLFFVITYAILTGFTFFNTFQLNDALIHYTKQQGVWGGGSPMGDFLYVCLLLLIGLVIVTPYLLLQSFLWLKAKMRSH